MRRRPHGAVGSRKVATIGDLRVVMRMGLRGLDIDGQRKDPSEMADSESAGIQAQV